MKEKENVYSIIDDMIKEYKGLSMYVGQYKKEITCLEELKDRLKKGNIK